MRATAPEIKEQFLSRIRGGEHVKATALELGVSESTGARWIQAARKTDPELYPDMRGWNLEPRRPGEPRRIPRRELGVDWEALRRDVRSVLVDEGPLALRDDAASMEATTLILDLVRAHVTQKEAR